MIVKIDDSVIDLAHCCEITPVYVDVSNKLKINYINFSIKLINQEPTKIIVESHWYKENGHENEKKLIEQMEAKRDELVKLWLQSRVIEAEFNFNNEEK